MRRHACVGIYVCGRSFLLLGDTSGFFFFFSFFYVYCLSHVHLWVYAEDWNLDFRTKKKNWYRSDCKIRRIKFLRISLYYEKSNTASLLVSFENQDQVQHFTCTCGYMHIFCVSLQLPLVVAALKMFVPPLFDLMIGLERYAPRTELKVTIAR